MEIIPFPSAEAAWFWTMAALEARHAGRKPAEARCAPEEVLRCLDDIYRRRRIILLHVRTLRSYGRRQRAPLPNCLRERCDRKLWVEAMQHLDDRLRERGLVAGVASWLVPA